MLSLIEELVKIPTYNQENCKLAINKCVNFFDNVAVEYYKNSTLLKNTKNNEFDVISTCHIDVVPMQNNIYKLKKESNIIKGRGVFDMKSFLVSAIFNLKTIIQENINIKYGIIIATDEETAKESDTKYWSNRIKTKLVLDSDSGVGNINSIVQNVLGAITIKTNCNYNKELFKKHFGEYHCDFYDDEVDILFDNKDIIAELKKYLNNFEILMLNNCITYDLSNNYQKKYKNIAENILKSDINYITTSNTTDSRFFKDIPVINHQATGGNYHKIDEWLDYESLLQFNKIQMEFLRNFNN